MAERRIRWITYWGTYARREREAGRKRQLRKKRGASSLANKFAAQGVPPPSPASGTPPPYYVPVPARGLGVRVGGLGGGEAAFRRGFNRPRFYVKSEAQAEQLVLAPRLAQLVKRLFDLTSSGT